jgi:hypothetical protein
MEVTGQLEAQMLYPGERKSGTNLRGGWVVRPTRRLDTMSAELSRYYCTILGIRKYGKIKMSVFF